MVGGQAGFAGHIQVADKTFVGAQCGVISNTTELLFTAVFSSGLESVRKKVIVARMLENAQVKHQVYNVHGKGYHSVLPVLCYVAVYSPRWTRR